MASTRVAPCYGRGQVTGDTAQQLKERGGDTQSSKTKLKEYHKQQPQTQPLHQHPRNSANTPRTEKKSMTEKMTQSRTATKETAQRMMSKRNQKEYQRKKVSIKDPPITPQIQFLKLKCLILQTPCPPSASSLQVSASEEGEGEVASDLVDMSIDLYIDLYMTLLYTVFLRCPRLADCRNLKDPNRKWTTRQSNDTRNHLYKKDLVPFLTSQKSI
jgi:hypothetical protein